MIDARVFGKRSQVVVYVWNPVAGCCGAGGWTSVGWDEEGGGGSARGDEWNCVLLGYEYRSGRGGDQEDQALVWVLGGQESAVALAVEAGRQGTN